MALQYFLLAFLAIQGISCQTLSTAVHANVERGLEDEFQKLIEKLRETIHEAIEKVIKIAKEVYDQLGDQIKELLEDAKKELQKIAEQVLSEIADLKEQATELGEEAVACVQKESGRIEELTQKTLEDNQQCIAVAKSTADVLVTEAIKIVSTTKDTVQKIIADWNACKNILCNIGVISKARDQAKLIVHDVQELSGKVQTWVQKDLQELKSCVAGNLQTHAEEMAVVVGDIRACINAIGGQ